MPTLAFPTSIRPVSVDWRLVFNTRSFLSPLSGDTQTRETPGARWACALSFEHLRRDEVATLEAFLARLRGAAGRFTIWNHARENPRGVATGAPVVDGAANSGGTLATPGWTASVTNILRAGDLIGVNGELKQVVVDANSDALGKVTLTIEPPLRATPADGATITTVKPTATFRLLDDDQGGARYRRALTSLQFQAVESFF
jgi:hypothetical protein